MISTETYEPKEIRASGSQHRFPTKAITVKSDQDLPVGQIMGQIGASGLWVAYDNEASDGSEVARGILAEKVDAVTAGHDVVASMYIGGEFVESKLTDLGVEAKADLGGLSLPSHDLFKF